MRRQSSGFTLLNVMIALVVFALGASAAIHLFATSTEAVSLGRRWTSMAAAASRELVRLERTYRALAPGCLPPPSGTALSADGVGLTWTASGDSTGVTVAMEVRAASSRRALVDTVVAGFLCQ